MTTAITVCGTYAWGRQGRGGDRQPDEDHRGTARRRVRGEEGRSRPWPRPYRLTSRRVSGRGEPRPARQDRSSLATARTAFHRQTGMTTLWGGPHFGIPNTDRPVERAGDEHRRPHRGCVQRRALSRQLFGPLRISGCPRPSAGIDPRRLPHLIQPTDSVRLTAPWSPRATAFRTGTALAASGDVRSSAAARGRSRCTCARGQGRGVIPTLRGGCLFSRHRGHLCVVRSECIHVVSWRAPIVVAMRAGD